MFLLQEAVEAVPLHPGSLDDSRKLGKRVPSERRTTYIKAFVIIPGHSRAKSETRQTRFRWRMRYAVPHN